MKRTIFFISFLLLTMAAIAQVQTVNKAANAKPEDRTVEITVVAIPYDQAGSIAIDTSTYHKATGVNTEDAKTILMTAPAQQVDAGAPGSVKKEIIQSKQQGRNGVIVPEQKMVEVKVAASKQ